jgi:hypothetical protein
VVCQGWDSGISTLLAAITFGLVIVSFVDWVFSPEDADTFRWVLMLIAIGYGLVGMSRRPTEPHHAVGFVNASGVALLGLAFTFLFESLFLVFSDGDVGSGGAGWGWELVLLAGAGALIAYAVLDRKAGPGYLGVANLIAFLLIAAGPDEDGASLIGWPLVLILVTIALFVAASGRGTPGAGVPARPRPDPGEAPTAVQPPS